MKRFQFILFLFFFTGKLFSQQANSIIPAPVSYMQAEGYFKISPTTFIYADDMTSFFDAIAFRDFTLTYYELALKTGHELYYDKNYIEVKYDSTLEIPDEGYILKVTQDKITVTGKNKGGTFHGLMTLFQLIESPTTRNFRIPCCEITDYPRFSYRGMHLDCSRHFFDVDFIKKYIDYLALYKYNTFHWHLTDDQGWRIEIKQYPKLTEIGAWRNGSMIGHYRDQQFDTIRYGGFYTQKEIKEIVKYAGKKHITIIPEIEMPGHCLAALAAYPEYGCVADTSFEVGKAWGGYADVFCPKEETFTFLENILDEVMQLFPSEYIHIGGDEVEKTRWKESAFCQKLIADKNLKDENGLQSYFVQRIEEYLNSKGRKIIGWDEILDGGIAPNATIMSWRGEEGGIASAKLNHDAIMTPGKYCYFDYYQGNVKYEPLAIGGFVPLEKVYGYDPIPSGLNADQSTHILGAQGNIWTEYITSPQQVEYMAMPRMLALSEVLWSKKENKNYNEFVSRVLHHFDLLDKVKCNYSKSIYQVNYKALPGGGNQGVWLQLTAYPFNNFRLQYNPDALHSTAFYDYEQSIHITSSTQIAASLSANYKDVFYGTIDLRFNKATGKKIILTTPPSKKYEGDGAFTLVNGIVATTDPSWTSNEWLGFSGTDCEAIIDLGNVDTVSKITVGYLEDKLSWIWIPKSMSAQVSTDGVNYSAEVEFNITENNPLTQRNFTIQLKQLQARYIKIKIHNYGIIPQGHPGAGKNAWLFVDEISIE